MRESTANVLMGVIILLIIMCVWNWAPGPWDHLQRMSNRSLAQRLTDAGWVLYIRMGCPWCHKQLGEFPPAEQKELKIIECQSQMHQCIGIKGVPLWHNTKTGEQKSGYKPKSVLAEMVIPK